LAFELPGSASGSSGFANSFGKIEQPSDLGDLEGYLTQRRKKINRKYDYRYSVLTLIFGKLYPRRPPQRGRVAQPDRG
jgi:hypothetical protein